MKIPKHKHYVACELCHYRETDYIEPESDRDIIHCTKHGEERNSMDYCKDFYHVDVPYFRVVK